MKQQMLNMLKLVMHVDLLQVEAAALATEAIENQL
jgi:hypothetical protein